MIYPLIKADCGELFSSIVHRKFSENLDEVPRSPTIQFHFVTEGNPGMKIDEYYHRPDSWTKKQRFNLGTKDFSVVHRGRKLIFMGGCDEQNNVLNTVRECLELSSEKRSNK